jgi:hypothetical protein
MVFRKPSLAKAWVSVALVSAVSVSAGIFGLPSQPDDDYFSPDIPLPEHPGAGLQNGGPESPLFPKPAPPAPSMERMKRQGCVMDGFLSDYGENANANAKLVNRSDCYYLHRALETWLRPPDFKLARKIQDRVTKPDVVYGMFIAEAIDTTANYDYPAENREFEFRRMCKAGTKNVWGEHTCQPDLSKEEYRKYLRYVTEQAMDMGIQSFLFGQIYHQENSNDWSKSPMPEIIREMREYAAFRGMDIVIGAQTNSIEDQEYLRLFDYVEGGVGVSAEGTVEDGPCFSRWWKKPGDWCWALLWHDTYRSKARNVFVHFDWSGRHGDDMSTFARMDSGTRAATLQRLYRKFTSQDVGFLMPLLAPLPKDNNGCHGPKERFYSPDDRYSCKDEGVINAILKKARESLKKS